jgi:hypothetical protein
MDVMTATKVENVDGLQEKELGRMSSTLITNLLKGNLAMELNT